VQAARGTRGVSSLAGHRPEAAPNIDLKGLRGLRRDHPRQTDLEECHVNSPLDFRRCEFQDEITFNLRRRAA